MKYAAIYSKAIKYGADHFTVDHLGASLTPDELAGRSHLQELAKSVPETTEPDWTKRMAFADALQDQGRDEEAEHVRNINQPIVNDNGVWKPGVVKWRVGYVGLHSF